MVSNEEFEQANRRASELRQGPIATAVRYDRRTGRIVIELTPDIELSIRPHAIQGLESAKPEQLDTIEISPSGLGLHFPKLDADVYVPALLNGILGSKRWSAAQLGKAGGVVKSEAKSQAARTNGKLGGRPGKATTIR